MDLLSTNKTERLTKEEANVSGDEGKVFMIFAVGVGPAAAAVAGG